MMAYIDDQLDDIIVGIILHDDTSLIMRCRQVGVNHILTRGDMVKTENHCAYFNVNKVNEGPLDINMKASTVTIQLFGTDSNDKEIPGVANEVINVPAFVSTRALKAGEVLRAMNDQAI